MLALVAEVQKDGGNASRLAALAERASRRDLLTQMFLIEQSVTRNDISAALTHYDIALRTEPASSKLLFRILNTAISDPQIRSSLAPYVQRDAPWIRGYLFTALDSEGGASNVADLLIEAGVGKRPEIFDSLGGLLLAHLVNQGDYNRARRVFLALPGTNSTSLRTVGFNARTTDPRYGPLGWQSVESADGNVAFERRGSYPDQQARVFVGPGAGAGDVLMRRVLALPAGKYVLTERRSLTTSGSSASVQWKMHCLPEQGTEPQWESVPSAAARTINAPGPTIPDGCRWQLFELNVSREPDQEEGEFVIEHLAISPAA